MNAQDGINDPRVADILAEARAEHSRQEAQRLAHEEAQSARASIFEAFRRVHDCTMDRLSGELGRESTLEEFYRSWADEISHLGTVLKDAGLAERVEQMPPGTKEKEYARQMVKLGLEGRTEEIVALFRLTDGLPDLRNGLANWLRYDLQEEILAQKSSTGLKTTLDETPAVPDQLDSTGPPVEMDQQDKAALRERQEVKLRDLLKTDGGAQRIRALYEEITGEQTPVATYINSLFPAILDRQVEESEVAITLKEFFPDAEGIQSLSPQNAGERLLFFFEEMVAKNQNRNAIKRDYIGGSFPVQHYPIEIQEAITTVFLEGWEWLATNGMIVRENKRDSFILSRRGAEYLKKQKENESRFVIFYSWQSDLPGTLNHYFIQDCIEEAIVGLSSMEAKLLPCVDRDTQGELGAPDIADTILRKIDNCDMFIADISIVARSAKTRPTSNPNVLFELGYAVSRLGWDRVTNVVNLGSGKVEELPFDLRKRRVVRYTLVKDEIKKSAKTMLVEAFKLQIAACIEKGKLIPK